MFIWTLYPAEELRSRKLQPTRMDVSVESKGYITLTPSSSRPSNRCRGTTVTCSISARKDISEGVMPRGRGNAIARPGRGRGRKCRDRETGITKGSQNNAIAMRHAGWKTVEEFLHCRHEAETRGGRFARCGCLPRLQRSYLSTPMLLHHFLLLRSPGTISRSSRSTTA